MSFIGLIDLQYAFLMHSTHQASLEGLQRFVEFVSPVQYK